MNLEAARVNYVNARNRLDAAEHNLQQATEEADEARQSLNTHRMAYAFVLSAHTEDPSKETE